MAYVDQSGYGPSPFGSALPVKGVSRSSAGSNDEWEAEGDSSGDDYSPGGGGSSRRDEKRPAHSFYEKDMHAPPPHTGRSLMGFSKPSSSASDYTKRRNWAASILDELADFLHVLGPAGNVVFASPSITAIAGYKPEDLVGRQLDAFIHHDDVQAFNRDLRQSVSTGLPLRLHYRLRKKDGRYVIVEILGHAYYTPGSTAPSVEDCKCVFAMGRPYPSRQAEEVDSFLELKLENERLRQDLERMRSEVENDPDARAALQRLKQAPRQDLEAQSYMPTAGGYPGHNTRHETRAAPSSKNAANPENGRRRKKQRTEEGEFVCRDCGTIDSPEWRKGPLGPKTLCNACGLRWAKKSKQLANAK